MYIDMFNSQEKKRKDNTEKLACHAVFSEGRTSTA